MKNRNQTVHRRLFLSYSLLAIAIILIGIVTFLVVLFTQIEREMMEYNDTVCRSLASQIDTEIQRMDDIAKRIIFTAEIRDLFAQDFEDGQYEARYDNQLKLSEFVVNAIGPVYRIERVNLISPNSRFLSIEGYASLTEYRRTESELAWLDWQWDENKRRLLLPPIKTNSDGQEPVFSIVRQLAMPLRFEGSAYVEIQQSYSVLEQIVKNGQLDTPNASKSLEQLIVYVFDGEGRLIYPYLEYWDEDIEEYHSVAQRMSGDGGTTYLNRRGVHARIASCALAENAEWTVLLIYDQNYMNRSIGMYTKGIALGGALAILLALILSYLLARRITLPIRQVYHHIKSLNPVTLTTSSPSLSESEGDRYDEIEELDIAFQNLCEALRTSIDETVNAKAYLLQAKLLVLQSQMSPHFLYNTLSAIGIIAEEGDSPRVVKMIYSLCDMLSYVSSDSTQSVEIKTEIEYTENFLSFLKIRYEDAIEYIISIPDDLLSVMIPKLVIQPLVENWSKYGMSGEGRYRISIHGEWAVHGWRVLVEDNGPGFSDELLMWFAQQRAAVDNFGTVPELRINRMGILNIYVRLRYAYGNDCVFLVENAPGGGGRVTIGGKKDAAQL